MQRSQLPFRHLLLCFRGVLLESNGRYGPICELSVAYKGYDLCRLVPILI